MKWNTSGQELYPYTYSLTENDTYPPDEKQKQKKININIPMLK
jgi:hypothetical protein